MRILLLGDYSNYQFCLSQGLARLGHNVTVASNGNRWMDTRRHIDISRRLPGKAGGLWLWTRLNTLLARDLKGYDIVQIHNPVFLDLKPGRVRKIFDRVRRDNGSVFLAGIGTDSPYVDMCMEGRLRYTEWQVGGKPTRFAIDNAAKLAAWQGPELTGLCRHVYDNIDGFIGGLYEYCLSGRRMLPEDKVAYGGIPIEMPEGPPREQPASGVRIMAACHKGRETEKGIDLMLPVVQQVVDDFRGEARLDFVQDVPFAKFKTLLDQADIIVDQLYSYSPATTALMAMARGKIVVSGGESEFYDFIGEPKLRPVINPEPEHLDSLRISISDAISHWQRRQCMALEGPMFVAKHNSLDVVARRFVDFWERRLQA